jgi:hypothetical protein
MSRHIQITRSPSTNTVKKSGTYEVTGQEYSVTVPMALYDRWRSGGEFIQRVFPDLSDDDREFLMTGTTPAEWDQMCEDGAEYPDEEMPF